MGRREYAQAAEAFQKALQLNPLHAQAAVRVRQAEQAAAALSSAKASASAQGATADKTGDKRAGRPTSAEASVGREGAQP